MSWVSGASVSCWGLGSCLIAWSSRWTEEVRLVFLSWATRTEKGAKNMINEINVRFASIAHLSTTSKRSAQPGKRRRVGVHLGRYLATTRLCPALVLDRHGSATGLKDRWKRKLQNRFGFDPLIRRHLPLSRCILIFKIRRSSNEPEYSKQNSRYHQRDHFGASAFGSNH